jgi:hypothetical protein
MAIPSIAAAHCAAINPAYGSMRLAGKVVNVSMLFPDKSGCLNGSQLFPLRVSNLTGRG